MKLTTIATLVLALALAPSAPCADDAGSMGTCLPNPETATMVSGPGTMLPTPVADEPVPADEPTTSAPERNAKPIDDLNAPAPVAQKPADDAAPDVEPAPEASTRELMALDEGAVKAMNEAQRLALKGSIDAQIRRWSAFEGKGGPAEGTLAKLRSLMSLIDGFTAADAARKAEEEAAAAKVEPATPPAPETPATPPVVDPVTPPAPTLDEVPPSNDEAPADETPVVEFVDETPAPAEDADY